MLIGNTGAGKSYLGNAMLGERNPKMCICHDLQTGLRRNRFKRKAECCPFEAAKAGNMKGRPKSNPIVI